MIMFTAAIFYDAESRGDSWLLALRWEQLQYKIKLNRKVIEKYNWENTAKEIKRAIYG